MLMALAMGINMSFEIASATEANGENTSVTQVQTLKAKYYLLTADSARPSDNGPQSAKHYISAGTGTIKATSPMVNDESVVMDNVQDVPNCSNYLAPGQKIVWYSIKKEADGYHVDGQIVNEDDSKPVNNIKAKYYLLTADSARPSDNGSQPTKHYVSAGIGTIKSTSPMVNDEKVVMGNVVDVPDCSKYLKEGQKVVWYSMKKEADGYHVDGQIVNIEIPDIEDAKFFDVTADGVLSVKSKYISTSSKAAEDKELEKITSLTIPSSINGVKVKKIGKDVLCKNNNIKEIIVSEGIEELENGCLTSDKALTKIVLPNTLKKVGDSALCYDSKLTDVVYNGLLNEMPTKTLLSGSPYRDSSIESIVYFGKNCLISGKNASGDIKIKDDVEYILPNAFWRNYKITSVTFGNQLKEIGDSAFFECGNLTGAIAFPDTVEVIGDSAFYGLKKIDSLKLSKNLKAIKGSAFEFCLFKNEIILPEGLEEIGDFAFNHCAYAQNKNINIPSTVKIIGSKEGHATHTFYDCATNKVESFTVTEGSKYFKAIDGVLYSKDGTRLVSYPGAKKDKVFEMPEGVKYIDELSFSHVGSYESGVPGALNTVIIPNSFVISENLYDNYINHYGNTLCVAFYIYTGIENIQVKPDNPNYTSVDGVLYSKDMKTLWYVPTNKKGNLVIPEGVEYIAHGAFAGTNTTRYKLSSISFPKSLKKVDEWNFVVLSNNTQITQTIAPGNTQYHINSTGVISHIWIK